MKKLFAAVLLLSGISFWACQKEYSYETTNDVASTGAWEFKDSANTTYAGNPQEYYVDDTTNPSSALMQYNGITANQRGALSIGISFPTGVAAPGTYTSLLGQVDFNYSFGNGNYYKAEAGTQFRTENITVVISAITDTSVTGTFSGTAVDSTNVNVRIVKEGKFTYKKRSASTTPTAPASAGTLGTTTDTCTGAIVSGTYKKAVAMASSNTVTIMANVTTIGTYTIYSDTLKGIYFRNTGTFAATGPQSVVIPALGTPTDSGTVRFRIRYGTSSCTFRVKIDTGGAVVVIPPTGDYFPTDPGKNWYYDDYDETGFFDTGYTRSTAQTIPFGGNTFIRFIQDENGQLDSNYYRKNSSIYYTLDNISQTGTPNLQEFIFLKDNIAINGSWTDSVVAGGITAAKFVNTIIAKGAASVTSRFGTISSSDVIKVRTVESTAFLPGVTNTIESWYAKGGGLIYMKATSSLSPTQFVESRLSRYN